jgi:hypothetical protein
MKTITFLLVCITIANATKAQNIIVEKIKITETVDKNTTSDIPKLKDLSNPQNPIVEKINSSLLETFDIPSFNQSEITEFRWYDVKFDAEVKAGIAYIHYGGEYYAAYPNYVEEELFFNLTTSEKIVNTDIPFQALFSLHGYLDFLNRYWLTTKLKDSFKEAIACANSEPYCTYYDITKYDLTKGMFSASLEEDCYAHVVRSCNPSYAISISIDSVKPYLTETSKRILLEDRYSEKKGIDKHLYNNKVWKEIPKNVYLFGLVDNKYPISMAITIDPLSGTTTGYYYYDKKKQKLSLKGTFANNILYMTETYNQKETGKFYFTWSDAYDAEAIPIYNAQGIAQYLHGTWVSMDDSKKLNIHFTEVKTTNR